MDIITTGIVTMSIFILIPLILAFVKRPSDKVLSKFVSFYYPRFFTAIAIVGMMTVTVAVTLMSIQGLGKNIVAEIFCFMMTSVIFLLCLCLFLFSLNWKLFLEEDGLTYKNALGISRRYSYSDISRIIAYYRRNSKEPEKYKLYVNDKRITIEGVTINFGNFERAVIRRLKNADNPLKIERKMAKW